LSMGKIGVFRSWASLENERKAQKCGNAPRILMLQAGFSF